LIPQARTRSHCPVVPQIGPQGGCVLYQCHYRCSICVVCRQYGVNHQQPIYQGYSQPSLPQDIPRISPIVDDLSGSPNGLWDARSPTSSDSGYSNASSPMQDPFGEGKPDHHLACRHTDVEFLEFHDDYSDFHSDSRSHTSDLQYQEEFDIDALLNLGSSEVQSPDTTSPTDFLSGPDGYPSSPTAPPQMSTFAAQSLQYASPFNSQGSPTFNQTYGNPFQNTGDNSHDIPQMRPTHHRASSEYLCPPSIAINRGSRSHSRGAMAHRSTISEGTNMFLSPDTNLESTIYLGDDLRGRGLSRAKSAPSSKAISRGRSPYDRPVSQTYERPVSQTYEHPVPQMYERPVSQTYERSASQTYERPVPQTYERPASQTGITRLEIPSFTGHSSGPSTPELESPSPASAKDIVATSAMVQASIKRRKREANYFCHLCGASFTTENSKRRTYWPYFQ
jgi:hypothetical protein